MSAVRPTGVLRGLGLAGGLALCGAGCSFDPSAAGTGPGGGSGPDEVADAAAAEPEPDAAVPIDDAPDAAAGEPDAMVEPAGLSAPYAASAPDLDGRADDDVWDGAEELEFSFADGELELSTPHPAYSPSVTVRFRLLHDATSIYVLVEVDDDLPGLIEIDEDILTDDGVGFFFDGAGDLGGPAGADDHTVIINASGATEHYGLGAVSPEVVHVLTFDGYVGEYAFDKSELVVGPGGTIGFNLALFDNDGLGGPTIDGVALWKLPEGPRCDDCCDDDEPMPWCDTTMLVPVALQQP